MKKSEREKLLQIAQARLEMYLKAEKAILSGQAYEIEGLKLTRPNLEHVQKMINKLKDEVATLSKRRGARLKYGVPLDRLF